MATIEVTRTHGMESSEIRAAVQVVAQQLQRDLSARYAWNGDRLNFECPGASGHIEVTGSDVRVAVDLGWLLKPMRGRIEQSINQYLDESLA